MTAFLTSLALFISLLVTSVHGQSVSCKSDFDCWRKHTSCLTLYPWLKKCICVEEYCYFFKKHGQSCSFDQQCNQSDQGCEAGVCQCKSHLKWLRDGCVQKYACDLDQDCLVYGPEVTCSSGRCDVGWSLWQVIRLILEIIAGIIVVVIVGLCLMCLIMSCYQCCKRKDESLISN